MVNQRYVGWCFVLAGIILLSASGRPDLLALLVPVAFLLAVVSLLGCDRKIQLSRPEKKG
jgi:hypothetical protein